VQDLEEKTKKGTLKKVPFIEVLFTSFSNDFI